MRRFKYLFVVFLLFFFSALFSFCWADVTLTDEQHQELTQILEELNNLNNEQATTIQELKQQNNELMTFSEDRKKLSQEQMKIIEEQNNSLKEDEKSLKTLRVENNILVLVIIALAFIVAF